MQNVLLCTYSLFWFNSDPSLFWFNSDPSHICQFEILFKQCKLNNILASAWYAGDIWDLNGIRLNLSLLTCTLSLIFHYDDITAFITCIRHLELNKKQCNSMHLHEMWFGLITDCGMEETVDLRNGVELAASVSDKHLDLLRPSARNYSIFRGNDCLWIWWYITIPEIQKLVSTF